ncbi:MAG: hypothetical protein V1709_11930 [Planctomycetota bacterium]
MSWFKAIIIGCCTFWGINLLGYLLFVQLGLGYSFSTLANTLGDIISFPTGTGKNYNIIINMVFWMIAFAVILKGVYFLINLKRG